jgi:endonuclease/exonuclease/phosphatase family metal-dependent hydrolase
MRPKAWLLLICTLAFLGPHLSPNWFSPFALLPWLIGPCYLLLAVWLVAVRRQPLQVAGLLAVLSAGTALLLPHSVWNPPAPPKHTWHRPPSDTLRVLTYNARYLATPPWFSPPYFKPALNPQALATQGWLAQHPAEVKLVQEFFDDYKSDIFDHLVAISGQGYHYHFVNRPKHRNGIRFGLAIFSKYPMLSCGEVFLSQNSYNGAIYADVKLGRDTLRVVNVHLQSTEWGSQPHWLATATAYFQAAGVRAAQTDFLLDWLAQSPYPVVLGGDLNETPASYPYRALGQQLQNAHEMAGQGWGGTHWLGGWLPLRIDHVWSTAELAPVRTRVRNDLPTSDHWPLEAYFVAARP